MLYGIGHISIVPLRGKPSDKSEMVSQVLYGDFFKIIDIHKSWCKIKLTFDGYKGWIDAKQFIAINKQDYRNLKSEQPQLITDVVVYVNDDKQRPFPITQGASINGLALKNHSCDSVIEQKAKNKSEIVKTSFSYLNSPYLWGGKTPFGIDCSGLTQMVYKLNGYRLLRDASQQVTQGVKINDLDKGEPGDLAFFENNKGKISHVGIILPNHNIIHAHGKVRVDQLDENGIYNIDHKEYSHKLKIIKRIVPDDTIL